jgi:hypothetical protein
MFGLAVTTTGIATFGPESESENAFSLLLQLDDIKNPGLSEEAFRGLFLTCRECRNTMTRSSTIFHKCKPTVQGAVVELEVVDLTNDE